MAPSSSDSVRAEVEAMVKQEEDGERKQRGRDVRINGVPRRGAGDLQERTREQQGARIQANELQSTPQKLELPKAERGGLPPKVVLGPKVACCLLGGPVLAVESRIFYA
jgi:hypothetical protein